MRANQEEAACQQLTNPIHNPRMLAMRERAWASLRQGCTDRLEELADVFGGKQKLSRYNWFGLSKLIVLYFHDLQDSAQ